jgi:hypothetical protein
MINITKFRLMKKSAFALTALASLASASALAYPPTYGMNTRDVQKELSRLLRNCGMSGSNYNEANCLRQGIQNVIAGISGQIAVAPAPQGPAYVPAPSQPGYGPQPQPGYYGPQPQPQPGGNFGGGRPQQPPRVVNNPIVYKICTTSYYVSDYYNDTFTGASFTAPLEGPSPEETAARNALINQCHARLADSIESQCDLNMRCVQTQ